MHPINELACRSCRLLIKAENKQKIIIKLSSSNLPTLKNKEKNKNQMTIFFLKIYFYE